MGIKLALLLLMNNTVVNGDDDYISNFISNLDFGIICGYVSGVITVISLVPQIITMIRFKNCYGVSWLMCSLMLMVSLLNLLYGIFGNLLPLILTNVFTIIEWLTIICLYVYYTYYYKDKGYERI